LNQIFDLLKNAGGSFNTANWEMIFQDILHPIFRNHAKNESKDQIWMSTTLIQALRNLISLFTTYYKKIHFLIDELLGLCVSFLLSDDETLGRLGSDCLVSFIEGNIKSFTDEVLDKIIDRIVSLLEVTSPSALYFDVTGKLDVTPFGSLFSPKPHKKEFNSIITKCVQHLLVIETSHKILSGAEKVAVYEHLSSRHLFKLGDALNGSYIFAKSFNNDLALRKELNKMGFMKQLPNLLKQETSSVSCFIIILSRMFIDETRSGMKEEVEKRLIP
jgi:brefeldin A-inhibited guanine nucleotide-exchange protein